MLQLIPSIQSGKGQLAFILNLMLTIKIGLLISRKMSESAWITEHYFGSNEKTCMFINENGTYTIP